MPKLPLLAGFKDPLSRPRYIIWSGVSVLTLLIVMIVALGITSSRWFCAEGCHKVQDDTIISYSHSSHDKVSCISCHMPVNSTPVQFMMHKVEALGELYLTVTNQYELPLNAGDKLALDKSKMPSEQCTQCHDMANRKITPSPGIIINHDIHAKNGITCTYCHNRVAHKEDFKLTLPGNEKHGDFMQMEACFRCHTLTPDKKTQLGLTATGKCSACHTPGFELKPASHLEAGFFPKGHGQLAKADKTYCLMCHNEQQFCYGCHALPMPHPADFKKGHGDLGKSEPQVCAKCHGQGKSADGTLAFCDNCHHKGSVPNIPWVSLTPGVPNQHPNVVKQNGATACFTGSGGCHNPVFCAQCHVEGIKH
jgi:nitrate/TMAO reductase-like tetraheme cytochrome c subunit